MGAALVKGWLRAGSAAPRLVIWDKYQPAVDRLLAEGAASAQQSAPGGPALSAVSSLDELAAAADLILVVVKPKDAEDVLAALGRAARPEQTVVSAMAGLTLEWLRDAVGPVPALYRTMPNLAVEIGAGAVAIASEAGVAAAAQAAAQADVLRLFGLLGLAVLIPEEQFDVVTAVSGSGPAFVALALEGLEDGAVMAGISRLEARRVVREAALRVAQQEAPHTGTSTVESSEDNKLRQAFREAVAAAMERSRQMRKV
jgi:pyrroline-5-carboxylate reductase